MAGFRIGRGRDSRNAQQQGQYRGPQGSGSQGPPGPGGPGRPGGPGGPGPYGQRHPQQQWPTQGAPGGHGQPEYFGEPHGGAPQYGPGPYARPDQRDPYTDNPGHTRSFTVPDPYGPDDGPAPGHPAPPSGPRLHWKDLLSGIVLRPNATFLQMRDHSVWVPAVIVTFLYGLLAIFGLDQAREEVINATISSAIPYVLSTGVAVVVAGLIMGAVTHTLARQFGGTGAWAPTIGLSMLIMSLTDAPRLLVALFMGGTEPVVQVLGWVTWIAAGALFTSMVSRSHDLPWVRALGASAVQLVALLVLIKLGTL